MLGVAPNESRNGTQESFSTHGPDVSHRSDRTTTDWHLRRHDAAVLDLHRSAALEGGFVLVSAQAEPSDSGVTGVVLNSQLGGELFGGC